MGAYQKKFQFFQTLKVITGSLSLRINAKVQPELERDQMLAK
jgi:hypothetical protein